MTVNVCGLPKFFKNILFDRIDTAKAGKISKQQFVTYWKRELEKADIKKRMFKTIAKPGTNSITAEDFKPLFR